MNLRGDRQCRLDVLPQGLGSFETDMETYGPRVNTKGMRGIRLCLLLQHNFAKARELYGDLWLGFPESDLHRWLESTGFKKIEISVVAREEQPPHFATILAAAEK